MGDCQQKSMEFGQYSASEELAERWESQIKVLCTFLSGNQIAVSNLVVFFLLLLHS